MARTNYSFEKRQKELAKKKKKEAKRLQKLEKQQQRADVPENSPLEQPITPPNRPNIP
ncbi:hypothetical protein [Desulfurivibrio sp. C05AmB]|uniref:hypothetical protein n=1 Tax=Desulfurivibrio sp. C05AmB TaxID=3374371 RepID=UPI00376EEC7B